MRSILNQSAKLFQVVAGGDGFHSPVPPSLFLRTRTYLRIKSAYECREAEDGGRLGGQERQHGQREGPPVGVRGRHGRPRVEAAAIAKLGPVVGDAEAGVDAAAGGGADAHVALVAQEAGEHDEGAAEHHAWKRHNGFEMVRGWPGLLP